MIKYSKQQSRGSFQGCRASAVIPKSHNDFARDFSLMTKMTTNFLLCFSLIETST